MSRTPNNRADGVIGPLAIGFAAITLSVWIPSDIDTGIIDVWRRSVRIGDAMVPVISAGGVLVCGAVILLRAVLSPTGVPFARIDPRFAILGTGAIGLSLAVMMLAGPALVWVWTGGTLPYRMFIDTPVIKHVGFVLGGGLLTASLIAMAYHRMDWRHWAIGFSAALILALMYDLPFDSLLLPPNGDV